MRTLGLPVLLLATGIVAACSSSSQDERVASADQSLTDMELARAALKILGAPQIPQGPGERASCSYTGCHSINPVTLKVWQDEYKAAVALIDGSRPNAEKIAPRPSPHAPPS